MKNYVTEFIGTFFLVLTIGLCVTPEAGSLASAGNFAPIAIGSALMVMVYMGGHVSGAHYNPAVTLAIFLRGKCSAADVAPYMLFQVAGAILAAFVSNALLGKTFAVAPGVGVVEWKAILNEFLFTFALALVVLNSATAKGTVGNSFYGLAIGFTVLAGAFAGGGISGGAYNPAVAIGPNVVHMILGGGSLGHVWIYLVGCFAGGAAAAYVFKMQNPEPDVIAAR